MKNLACATGLVVLCLLKATLVWISCGRAGAHRRGVAQPRRSARVTGSGIERMRRWPASRLLFRYQLMN